MAIDISTENVVKHANFMAGATMRMDDTETKIKDMLLALVAERDEAQEVALFYASKARRLEYNV